MAEHSKLGASSYYRWGGDGCPGSVRACEGIDSESSIYADEGTAAHEVGSYLLKNGRWLSEVEVNGKVFEVTEEMAAAVQVYIDHVGSLRAKRPTFENVEQKLDLSKYHPQLFGTADYVAYFGDSKTLHVVDYKHGQGVQVDADRNPQLMYYGLGALHANAIPIEKIVLTIVQPRGYHHKGPVRSWETDPLDMIDFSYDLIEDAKATERPDAPLVSGDHCRFCPAAPTCPEAGKAARALETKGFTPITAFNADELGKTLSLIPQIEAWCKAVDSFAYQQAAMGNLPSGWKLVDKRANRKWGDMFKAVDCARALGIDSIEMFEQKLLSPAAVEKKIGKSKEKAEILEKFVVRQSSGQTLVPDTDDRPKVKGALEAMFTPVN